MTEFEELWKEINELKNLMQQRLQEGERTWGSIKKHPYMKFLEGLGKNTVQFASEVQHFSTTFGFDDDLHEEDLMPVQEQAADILNFVGIILVNLRAQLNE